MDLIKYKYDVGDIVSGLLILNKFKKDKYKYYKYECQNDHYIGEIRESHLSSGHGCPVCSNKAVLIGYNDIYTTNPKLASMMQDIYDGYCYTEKSAQKVNWVCPECGNIINNIPINRVNQRGLPCPFCGDGTSYPNKFMCNLLSELNIHYIREFSPNWIENKRYDFFIPSKNLIIEMDGGFHYKKSSFNNYSTDATQAIDKFKDDMAIQNGYKIIRIDCNYNSLEKRGSYITAHVTSALNDIFDLSAINFNIIDRKSTESYFLKAIKLYNGGYDVKYISEELDLHIQTVRRYLMFGTNNGMCNFNNNTTYKPIMCIDTNQCFKSITLCEKISEEVFGTHVSNKNMARQIKAKRPQNGFLFKYISAEEFNKRKKESPELVFGDFFIL